MRQQFGIVQDQFADRKSPTRRQHLLEELVAVADLKQSRVPFSERSLHRVSRSPQRAMETLKSVKHEFMEQYRIQYLNANADNHRAPAGSNFKMADPTNL